MLRRSGYVIPISFGLEGVEVLGRLSHLPTWKDLLIGQLAEQLEADPKWRAPAVDGRVAPQMVDALTDEVQRYVERCQGASGSTPASRKVSDK